MSDEQEITVREPKKLPPITNELLQQAASELAPAHGSVASCEWVRDEYGTKCGRPAKVRDTKRGVNYCERHGEVISKAFGSVASLRPLNVALSHADEK